MAQNFGSLTRDIIGKTISIGGKNIVDKDRNIHNIKHASVGSLTVRNDINIKGDVTTLNSSSSNGKIGNATIDSINASCLKSLDCERLVTPNYDRFKQGALPKLNIVPGTSNTYEYENLSSFSVPEQGDAWSTIIRGFINFDTASASERLKFYVGATNRLYRLVINRAWSSTEQEIKTGYVDGWSNTDMSPGIPADQQKFAADALQTILDALLLIQTQLSTDPMNTNYLNSKEIVNLNNHITICFTSIEAWNLGNFFTANMGADYYGVANVDCMSNFVWRGTYYAPFISFSALVAYGYNTDPGYLLTWARALPTLFTYYPKVLEAWKNATLKGLDVGFYPHILRANPYDSKGKSTFGEPGYGYEQYIVDAVQDGTFSISSNNAYTNALDDYETIKLTFEENLSDNVVFGTSQFGGINPKYMLDIVVEGGYMEQTEADFLLEICKQLYYSHIQPSVKSLLEAFYFDETSDLVKAFRLTRWDDYPGEWGSKYLLDSSFPNLVTTNNNHPLVKAKKNSDPMGPSVLISVFGDDVVIYNSGGNVDPVSLKDVTLERDEIFGETRYRLEVQLVTGLKSDDPVATFVKTIPLSPFDPITNPYIVKFITINEEPDLVQRLHMSGESNIVYVNDNIEYYLNQWSIEKYGQPWNIIFPDRPSAIAALSFDDRFIADLEDPLKGGNYAFIQHYKPIDGPKGYNYSDLRAFYTDDPTGVPNLKPLSDPVWSTVIKTRDGIDTLYDPSSPPVDGFIDITALYEASIIDNDLREYYAFMSSTDIANGKSAKYFYFNFDFHQHAYESFITGGVNPTPQPVMSEFFSPYINSVFAKRQSQSYSQILTASSSFFNQETNVLSYVNYLDVVDPRLSQQGANRSVFVHEWLMGHAMQVPLINIISSTGQNPWTATAFFNSATAEGWAIFVELFFCGVYTTYLSETDHYLNYLYNDHKQDPKTVVSQLLGASRFAARLKWDTGIHGSKTSMADYFTGFYVDTFGAYDANSEVTQRIPVGPSQGLTYGVGYGQIAALFQQLSATAPSLGVPPEEYPTMYPDGVGFGQVTFDKLQANGHKAWKYFFDLILIDSQGYFLGSFLPVYNLLVYKVVNSIAPFDQPPDTTTYDGYQISDFDVNTVPYVVGSNPTAYEYTNNPYVPGGYDFVFPTSAVPAP